MKKLLKNTISVLDWVYGWGVLICLFVGGATFFGYLAAFIIGGAPATAICDFIYKVIFKVLIYGGNIVVLLGLLSMYLKKQKSLTMNETAEKKN